MTQPFSFPHILPLTSDQATLPMVGGKAANLSRLRRAGFPVPGGFLVTTQAYRDFVQANFLEEQILVLIQGIDPDHPESLEATSTRIRALFSAGSIPGDVANELREAYERLGERAVAVRSSATAEDLPELSFAGQQDTYLNVVGADRLLQAVVDCWSSLWTARAIGYRTRNGVSHDSVSLGVVVQSMIQSQASGVLFTANPLTGLRKEMVIDATLGLGEALVSGQVEPDHYVVDSPSGRIVKKFLGSKRVSIHGQVGGGTQLMEQVRSEVQALPDEQILALARLGGRVADLYAFPQDIEWAWAGGEIFLLQSRPITSLFPLPDGMPAEPVKVLVSFAAVQGIFDPITPIGRDAARTVFAAGAGLFGVRVTAETQSVLYTAGERLWVNFTPILSNSIGRRIVPIVFGLVEPTVRQAVEQIWDDPRLQPVQPGIRFHTLTRIARFMLPVAANMAMNLIAPRQRREKIVQNGERILKEVEARSEAIRGDRWEKLVLQADLLPGLANENLPHTFILFVSGVAAGMASWNFLNILANGLEKSQTPEEQVKTHDLVLQITRGMPYNPTTEMDLALWKLARDLRKDPLSLEVLKTSSASDLAARYQAGGLPDKAQQAVDNFLAKYGGRGLGEVDLGRTRWAEDPTHVFEILAGFLQIEDEALAPDVVFSRGADSARLAVNQLAAAVQKTRFGWVKARLVRFFAGRARQLMGTRESPKFFAVRLFWSIRRALLETGRELVQAGELDAPDDLFYLSFAELKAFAGHQDQDWRGLIAGRRAAYQRELLRKQIPRLLLSNGRAFYQGMDALGAVENTFWGSPVSPGSVEGRIRVVLDPREAHLQPGEILVCPGTDPSWTPLFLTAGGLVMETGGMMTHGAVVAREYGIPAIVGVDQASRRLHTGQLIRLDGSSGEILVLDGGES